MNAKQTKFVLAYLDTGDAEAAATKCGLTASEGRAMITQGVVLQAIESARLSDALSERVYQKRILGELAKIAFSDMRQLYDLDGNILPPVEWSDEIAGAVSSIKVKQPSQSAIERAQAARREALADDAERFEDDLPPMPKPDVEVRLWDKVAALKLAGSHLAMFIDRQEMTTKGGVPLDLIDVLNAARQRVLTMRPDASLLARPDRESDDASCEWESEGVPHHGPREGGGGLNYSGQKSDSQFSKNFSSPCYPANYEDLDEFLDD